LDFCPKHNSKLFQTSDGLKCRTCDNYDPIKEKSIITRKTYSDDPTSYVKNEYYIQKEIRKSLGLGTMRGINLKRQQNIIVIFSNAHALKPNQNNVYIDKYDSKTGYYYYTGEGLEGDQPMSGGNLALKKAKETNKKVHLFWQHTLGSDHQYVGKVEVKYYGTKDQYDKNGRLRKVHVFLLKPIQDIF